MIKKRTDILINEKGNSHFVIHYQIINMYFFMQLVCYVTYVYNKINVKKRWSKIADCHSDQIIGYPHCQVPSKECASHCNVTRNDAQMDYIFLPHLLSESKSAMGMYKMVGTHSQEKICGLIIGKKKTKKSTIWQAKMSILVNSNLPVLQ